MAALHQASTEVRHRVSTEDHQDRVNTARHRLKANTVHLHQAKGTEPRRQVSTVSDRRRVALVALVDTQASSNTANPHHQVEGTSIDLLAVTSVAWI